MAAAPQVRTGRVSSIDYERGTYEVVFADRGSVSCTINAQSNGEYKMPEIGQMVSCTMNGNGTVAGATLGTVWNATNKPAEGYKGLYRKEYGRVNGDSYERYDANTGEYTQYTRAKTGRNSRGVIYDECGGAYTARSGGPMTLRSTKGSVGITAETGVGVTAREAVSVEAGTYVSVNAADALDVACGADCTLTVGGDLNQEITGDVVQTVTGDVTLTVSGNLTLTVGGTVITVTGDGVTVSAAQVTVDGGAGDVVVDGVSLVHHKHKDGGTGEPEKDG